VPALALTDTRLAAEQLPPAGLFRRAGGWIALGTAGSLLLTLAGPRLAGGPRWWFHPAFGSGRTANTVALYAGMALLSAAWLGLRRHAHLRSATPRQLAPVVVLWSLPLVFGAPLFSHDVYSYLAQGTIARLGLNPYHVAPAALGRLGHPVVMNAVDPFWRHATAPYGPLFLAIMSGISALVGSHVIGGALLTRVLALVGLALVWAFVPRLARALGTDSTRAVWLAALSPLVLLQLASPGHNDLLMVGLLAAGVTLAAEGRPLAGIAVCAAAMTIKLPAGFAIAFIAVAWLRDCEDWRTRLRNAAEAALVVGAVVAIVSVATGWGLDWISGTLFSTPARVRLAITPATNVAWTLSSLLHDVGIGARFLHVESVTRAIAGALGGLVALVLLIRARRENMVRSLGVASIAIAIAGPAAWPWYFSWGVVLLSATVPFQLSRAVPVALIAGAFLVKANGILLLPLRSAPIVLAVYAAIAVASWYLWRRRRGAADRAAAADAPRTASPSVLARSSPG
jgi:alpha-1,6-mannosyltransferase